MIREVDAVYEHGILRPLQPLSLTESQRVKLTISTHETSHSYRDAELLATARAEVAANPTIPTIEEVREMLAAIPGSLAADVIAERGEY